MTRGGEREGAGRPKGTTGEYKLPEEKTKMHSYRLYPGEDAEIKKLLKKLRA